MKWHRSTFGVRSSVSLAFCLSLQYPPRAQPIRSATSSPPSPYDPAAVTEPDRNRFYPERDLQCHDTKSPSFTSQWNPWGYYAKNQGKADAGVVEVFAKSIRTVCPRLWLPCFDPLPAIACFFFSAPGNHTRMFLFRLVHKF